MEQHNCSKLPSIFFLHFFFFFFLSSFCTLQSTSINTPSQTYIVHVLPSPESSSPSFTPQRRESYYRSFLPTNNVRIIHSYHNVVSGFAARLTAQELAEIARKPNFLRAYPDGTVPLLTTHTPDYLGLDPREPGLWIDSNLGRGVIVGVLDTGVTPDHPSFHDDGEIPPPPPKWKGVCEFDPPTICNNKLIGARNFVEEPGSPGTPYDDNGHGTHTASTAAGVFVGNVDIEGQAAGTAVGMAPYAHLATYKVCGSFGCQFSAILAGMDAAVGDGVDVMSLSLGGSSLPYYHDSIAIGAFGAVEKGIFVSCAAGNSGPSPATLSNEAPWMLTVGASTIDRKIRTTVKLGNGGEFHGESIHQPQDFLPTKFPLVYPGSKFPTSATCSPGSLDGIDVGGKIVVCDVGDLSRVKKGGVVAQAGGVAMILTNTQTEGYVTFADVHVLPASHVSYADGKRIKSYVKSASKPKASISFDGTVIGPEVLAPVVSYFSSRGPNQADPSILKPDIVGPGVNILAAWPTEIGTPGVKYNMISGTSMATPHLSGIAALLKSIHPDWSPAAIKSAIMTTAGTTTNGGGLIPDESRRPADYFTVGAGHVNAASAADPGLIYDISIGEYIASLCGLGYDNDQVSVIARQAINCSEIVAISGAELNYPSFMVFLNGGLPPVTVTRTVTNVGPAKSTYNVKVKAPKGTTVTVQPKKLNFSDDVKKLSYGVTFSSKGSGGGGYAKGSLAWVSFDNKYKVNSPIMVSFGVSAAQSM